MLELMLLQSAARFGLHDPAERERSSRELRRLFVALQRAVQPAFALDIGAYRQLVTKQMRAEKWHPREIHRALGRR